MAVSAALKAYYTQQSTFFSDKYGVASGHLSSDAIHEMRVCLKRLRTFFDLAEAINPDFEAGASFAPVRRLFRAAGKVRNLHVLEEAVRQASRDEGLELSEYYNWLKDRELREAKRFSRACRRFDPGFFEAAWPSIVGALKPCPTRLARRHVQSRLSKLLRCLEKDASRAQTACRLHAMRTTSKEARYTLEILSRFRTADDFLAPLDKLLRGVHQSLGRWHDDGTVSDSLSEFRKGLTDGPKFSAKSYLEFSRLARLRRAKDLADFRTAWAELARFIAAAKLTEGPVAAGPRAPRSTAG